MFDLTSNSSHNSFYLKKTGFDKACFNTGKISENNVGIFNLPYPHDSLLSGQLIYLNIDFERKKLTNSRITATYILYFPCNFWILQIQLTHMSHFRTNI